MSFSASNVYQESQILSASPLELVRILYRQAISAVANARRYVREGNIPDRSREITRAQMILAELQSSLDHEKGGSLSRNLLELYVYMFDRLRQANAEQTEPPLAEVAQLLQTLLEGWRDCNPEPKPATTTLMPPAEFELAMAGNGQVY